MGNTVGCDLSALIAGHMLQYISTVYGLTLSPYPNNHYHLHYVI
jgi:hypothetical protein